MASNSKLSRVGSIVILILAGITLFLAQSAYWVNHTVFNQANFTQTTTSSLLSEPSREAIASAIVDKSLENRPVLKRTISERVEALITGLLGSDISTQAVETLSDKSYAYATSKDREDVKIDLTTIKDPLSQIIALIQRDTPRLEALQAQIPDEIVLLRSDNFPNLAGLVQLMLVVGPLLWLSTIVLFGLYIYLGRAEYARRVYLAGLTAITVAILGLLTIPFIPPPIAAAVQNIELRPVAESLVANFLAPFKTQMYYLLAFVLFALLIFNQRFNLFAALKSLETRLGHRPPKKTKKS